MDKTERRIAEKQETENLFAVTNNKPTNSHKTVRFSVALEMYSEFIRNLEFADKEEKRFHLEVCLNYWELTLRGWLSALREAIINAREDLSGPSTCQPPNPL